VLRAKVRQALRDSGRRVPAALKKGRLKKAMDKSKLLKNKKGKTPTEVILGESKSDADENRQALEADHKHMANMEKKVELKPPSQKNSASQLPRVPDVSGGSKLVRDAKQKKTARKASARPGKQSKLDEASMKSLRSKQKTDLRTLDKSEKAHSASLKQVSRMSKSIITQQKTHNNVASTFKTKMDSEFQKLKNEQGQMEHFEAQSSLNGKTAVKPPVQKKAKKFKKKENGNNPVLKNTNKKEVAQLKTQLKATKVHAEKLIEQNKKHALLAVQKVKQHLVSIQAAAAKRAKATNEANKKQEVNIVKKIAGKAALALNAANLAHKLEAAKGARGTKGIAVASLKKTVMKKTSAASTKNTKTAPASSETQIRKQLVADKAYAEKAAHQWRVDAHRLASAETEKANKAKLQIAGMKEKEQKKIRALHAADKKQNGLLRNTLKAARAKEHQAKLNAKSSRVVTGAFTIPQTLAGADAKKKKAEKSAVKSAKKAKVLMKKAQQEAAKAKNQEKKALNSQSSGLQKALSEREKAKAKLKKAEERVSKAGGKVKPVIPNISVVQQAASSLPGAMGTKVAFQAEKKKAQAALFSAKSKTAARAAEKRLAAAKAALNKNGLV